MAKVVRKGLIYLEDLATGSGTATRGTSTGGTQTVTKINLSGVGTTITTVTSTPYSATISDGTILVNVSSAATINLPTAVGNSGQRLTVKNITNNTVTLDGSGTQTIDGALTHVLSGIYEKVTIQSDGSNWHIVS